MSVRRRRAFDLEVLPRPGGRYGLTLFELDPRHRGNGDGREAVVRVWGPPMESILDRILDTLKRNGARASDLRPSRKKPFRIDEEAGVRLGLLFLAIKPMRKLTRIEQLSNAVETMSTEETYYWFAKCCDHHRGRRAQKAFRTLEA